MSLKIRPASLFLITILCGSLPLATAGAPTAARGASGSASSAPSHITAYRQPPSPAGGLLLSAWWDPNGSDYDQYVWDNFTLPVTRAITEVQWLGGYDPIKAGSGGPVIDFVIGLYGSLPGGSQPDLVQGPLAQYAAGGPAGQAPAGTLGGTPVFSYHFALPAPFAATVATRYWISIVATQHGIPDWGIAAGAGGDGKYFRRRSAAGDIFYETPAGDAAFTLLSPPAGPYGLYLPQLDK